MIEKVLAIGTGVIGLMTGMYYVTDYTEIRPVIKREFLLVEDKWDTDVKNLQQKMDINSKSLLLLQFQLLEQKQKTSQQPLGYEEQRQLCEISGILDYRGVPGCN